VQLQDPRQQPLVLDSSEAALAAGALVARDAGCVHDLPLFTLTG
jgi:hypothetical protein